MIRFIEQASRVLKVEVHAVGDRPGHWQVFVGIESGQPMTASEKRLFVHGIFRDILHAGGIEAWAKVGQ